jgi:hypothetical protein
MAFRIQHPDSGLFWNSTKAAGSIVLVDAPEATLYEVEQPNHIRNVATGLCLRHYAYVMREDSHGTPEYDFEYDIESDGTILNPFDGGHFVGFVDGVVRIVKDGAVKWVIAKDGEPEPEPEPVVAEPEVEEAAESEEDVPVPRASALIEEALNADEEEEEEEPTEEDE